MIHGTHRGFSTVFTFRLSHLKLADLLTYFVYRLVSALGLIDSRVQTLSSRQTKKATETLMITRQIKS